MANSNLTNAKRVKNDEFYTQYNNIQKEIEAYLEFNPDAFSSNHSTKYVENTANIKDKIGK